MGSNSVDDLLTNFGDPGKYQKCVFAMLISCILTAALNIMMTIFSLNLSPHHCKIPEGISLNDSIPRLENGELDSCSMYLNFSNHSAGITNCINGWTHYTQNGKWSIVQEWDSVCDKYYRTALANSMYFLGGMIGCFIFGYLADRTGRRLVILVCLYTYVVIGIGIAFVNNYYTYITLRCIEGIVLQGLCASAYTMSIELFLPHRRTIVAFILHILWPATMLLVTVFDYFILSWRIFHLIISVPFVFTFAYIWFLPESPRWLVALNKVERAKDELKRFARYNHLSVPPNLESEITRVIERNNEMKSPIRRNYGFIDLFRSKRMFVISFAACLYNFVSSFAFYVIAFSMMTIGSDVHLSYVITSLIDVGFSIIAYFALVRTTRKRILYSTLTLNTVVSVLVIILLISLPTNNASLLSITVIAGFGRAGITAFFAVMPVYVSEMSPTVVRTLVMGMGNLWGKIGGIIAPQMMLLSGWKPLPFLVCACMTFVCLLIAIPLPETKNKPLQDIPEDIGKLWKTKEKIQKNTKMIKPTVKNTDEDVF